MNHSKFQKNRRMTGRRSLLLLAVLSLVISLLGLPLYAKTMPVKSPAGRMVDDVKRDARDLGRGVRDMIDPNRDGILPDGSLDNGIANDGNQWRTNDPVPDMTTNVSDNVTGEIPDTPQTGDGLLDDLTPPTTSSTGESNPSVNDPTPDNNGNTTSDPVGDVTTPVSDNKTDPNTTTTAPTTTTGDNANNNDNTDNKEEGGFRWTGLIVAIIIAVAVIVLICLLIPKKKVK